MCTRRGFWEGHCNVHQEGSLGRTLGCASRGMLGKDGGNGDLGCVELPALGRRSPTEICPVPGWCVGREGVFYFHHRA